MNCIFNPKIDCPSYAAQKELGYEPRGGLADDIFIKQGQTPLEMAGEINEPDPDNINGNQEDTDEEGSDDIGEDEQTSSEAGA